jgi:hypothetical protein
MHTRRQFGIAVLGLAALAVLLGGAGRAQAGIVYTLSQVGTDVVGSGSGSFDITALRIAPTPVSSADGFIRASTDDFSTRSFGDQYFGITVGPLSFGPGGNQFGSSASGDMFGLVDTLGEPALSVPSGYKTGTLLSATDTWSGQTFASLGVSPGTYTWTWGSTANGNADFFTLQIGPAVPEPTSLTLLATGALGLLGYAWRRRKRAP